MCLYVCVVSFHSAAPPSRPGFDVSHGGSSQRPVFPIASLSPYQTKSVTTHYIIIVYLYTVLIVYVLFGRWTIRVRVTSKPAIRTWSNSRGEGRLLNVDLVDETVCQYVCVCVCVCVCVIVSYSPGRDKSCRIQ